MKIVCVHDHSVSPLSDYNEREGGIEGGEKRKLDKERKRHCTKVSAVHAVLRGKLRIRFLGRFKSHSRGHVS